MKVFSTLLFVLFCFNFALYSQSDENQLPTAFVIGDNEAAYEQLFESHNQTLLSACGDDMQVALEKWFAFINDIESYANKLKFDIDGVKAWLRVFWDEQGNVEHIGFFLQPDSRNISTKELSAFFSSFSRKYKIDLSSGKKFAHYTSAAFPTFNNKLVKE